MRRFLDRWQRACRAFLRDEEVAEECDPSAPLRAVEFRLERIRFALSVLETPMPLTDELTKLDNDIQAAIAATAADGSANVAALAAANATIASLNEQLTDASTQVAALDAKVYAIAHPPLTTVNADGSTTVTTYNPDGSSVAVTTATDGSTVTVTTAADGTSTTATSPAPGAAS